jgi:hypothetical protein
MFLLLGAIFAKDLEFELEITDFYDPSAVDDKQALAKLLGNLTIEGGYRGAGNSLVWDDGSGGCGNGVAICVKIPGPRIEERYHVKYKDASQITIKDNKIRFKLPDKRSSDELHSIAVNKYIFAFLDINEKVSNEQILTLFPEQLLAFDGGSMSKFGVVEMTFKIKTPISLKLSLLNDGEIVPIDIWGASYKSSNASIGEKTLINNVELVYYFRDDDFSPKNADFSKLNEVRFIYNDLEITAKNRDNNDTAVKEYRYYKGGKLVKIEGQVHFRKANEFEIYFVNFSSKKVSEFGDGRTYKWWKDRSEDALSDIVKFEKEVLKKLYKNSEDDEVVKMFKEEIGYFKKLFSSSHEELQKELEFDRESLPAIDFSDPKKRDIFNLKNEKKAK